MAVTSSATTIATHSALRLRWYHATLVAVYTLAAFLGASLVFVLEPMITKMALPVFGGAPAVWNTALVFFQLMLLCGYGYAHLSLRWLGWRRQSLAHMVVLLLPLLALPIVLPGDAAPPADRSPVIWLLYVLGVSVALPFFVVSVTSPLLQSWFATTSHTAARDPYFLYAAGNAGSLLGLLAYPLVIEPRFTLHAQSRVWSAGYIAFVLLCAACALLPRLLGASRDAVAADTSAVAPQATMHRVATSGVWRERAWWIVLAFVPSSLMVGATSFISTDVAPAPLLWVVPLAIYLLTFIVAFSRRPLISARAAGVALPFAAVAAMLAYPNLLSLPVIISVVANLALLLFVSLFAHGRLAAMRPSTARLTEFYLLLSVGGVLGGVFNALIAPTIFNDVLEYPIVIVLALLLRGALEERGPSTRAQRRLDLIAPALLLAGVVAGLMVIGEARAVIVVGILATLAFARRAPRFAVAAALLLGLLNIAGQTATFSERTFFGVLHVDAPSAGMHVLHHGTTIHGEQSYASDAARSEPLTYYTRSGPLGQALTALEVARPVTNIGVVGLGAGSIAAYGQAGQALTFYEIDPAVARIASNPAYFTYLRDSAATVNIVIGDGRLKLADAPPGAYDILVLDAFSSDSVPVHLLTREALQLYVSRLAPHGVIAFHITNRHLDLEPIVAAIVDDLGLSGRVEAETSVSASERAAGKAPSTWVVIARSDSDLGTLATDARWQPLERHGATAWTDEFSNIIAAIRWFH